MEIAITQNKPREFEPTPQQKQLVAAVAQLDTPERLSHVALNLGIGKTQIFHWLRDPGFLEYLNENLNSVVKGDKPEVWGKLMEQIRHGNVRAIELYFKLTGEVKNAPTTAQQFNIFSMSNEDLMKKLDNLQASIRKRIGQLKDGTDK